RPGSSQEWFDLRQPSYSMFGTDRTITDFGLHISAVADGEEQDRCTVWGSPSYTIDIDFRDETPDDTVVFHLYVQQDTFERYVNAIKAAQVEAADLSLRRVSGFYSEWSPGISSDFVKVLTSEKEHVVEAAEGSAISPPRLGEVGEVSLTFLRMLKIENPKPEPVQNDDWQHISDPAESSSDTTTLAAQSLTNANIRAVALLASLRTAAWVIAVLLLLILVT
ncbi:MAG: hypothetical protein KGM18_08855, partial [Sphingomonadales bacterium]|nr:hypothetical protein [Sphingomonadales bacterium]